MEGRGLEEGQASKSLLQARVFPFENSQPSSGKMENLGWISETWILVPTGQLGGVATGRAPLLLCAGKGLVNTFKKVPASSVVQTLVPCLYLADQVCQ